MRAIIARRLGGPEVLELAEMPRPEPAAGQVLVRLHRIGVNFSDTERRRGVGYAAPPFPWIPGGEGAGVVEAVGEGADPSLVGERVAFWALPPAVSGAYAEFAVTPATSLFRLGNDLSFEQGAALALQGLTAYGVVHFAGRVREGETVLLHAAGGGVGLIALQLARIAGARVLGTVSSEAKAEAVRARGGEPLPYGDDLVERVLQATGGRGVDVVLDSVGRATQEASLASLAPFGRLVLFGDASGPPGPITPDDLYGRCLTVGAFGLNLDHDPERWERTRRDLMRRAAEGSLQLMISRVLPLAEAAEAHRLLESRAVVGKILLSLD
jgi:NADPH2:quinone reductase